MHARWFKCLCFYGCLIVVPPSLLHAQKPPGNPFPGSPSNGPGAPGNHGAPPTQQPPRGQDRSQDTGENVQFGPVGRWWDDKSVVKKVGLTNDQKKKMDAIFDANKPAILAAYRDLLKQQSALESVSKDPSAGKAQTFSSIDAVNRARAVLEKTVAQTYLQIRQLMAPEQIEQLQKLQ